ncbi:hypothetical protein ACET3Z_009602 [Daucus carota]
MVNIFKGLYISCDIPMAQFIINMNAALPQTQKFILHVLDDTHLFVRSDMAEGSRPVGTHAQPESSHARISQIPMPPQIHDEAADDDDDVIISSAREFEQARRKKNRRRNHRRTLNSEGQSTKSSPNNLSKRIRGPSNLEIENAWSAPQKKLEFTCPVCLGPIVQEMSTKCGHVFCKDCITQSTATQVKFKDYSIPIGTWSKFHLEV